MVKVLRKGTDSVLPEEENYQSFSYHQVEATVVSEIGNAHQYTTSMSASLEKMIVWGPGHEIWVFVCHKRFISETHLRS